MKSEVKEKPALGSSADLIEERQRQVSYAENQGRLSAVNAFFVGVITGAVFMGMMVLLYR